ncbi:MAG: hypothetical protein J6X60_04750 [Ruminiclostridium sp.]|nr:hypothetical protein [Ruminiclostridium sp.]
MAAESNEDKRSGFDGPAIGKMLPPGAEIKLLEDGGWEIIYPEGSDEAVTDDRKEKC